MRGCHVVGHVHVYVCLLTSHEMCRRVFVARTEVQPVVEQYESGGFLPYCLHHPVKVAVHLLPELSAHSVHLEQFEVVFPHQLGHHVHAFVGFRLCVAEPVGTAPHPETRADGRRFAADGVQSAWELPPEAFGACAPIPFRTVERARVEGVYVELHAVSVVHPFEEVEVYHSLFLGGSLVSVVYP